MEIKLRESWESHFCCFQSQWYGRAWRIFVCHCYYHGLQLKPFPVVTFFSPEPPYLPRNFFHERVRDWSVLQQLPIARKSLVPQHRPGPPGTLRPHGCQGRLAATPRMAAYCEWLSANTSSGLGSSGCLLPENWPVFPLSVTTSGDLWAKSWRTKRPKFQSSWLSTQWAEITENRVLNKAGLPTGVSQ